jgi:hypothetical protein
MIAADVVMLIRMMLDKSGTQHKIHTPGSLGLVGGYPVLFRDGDMEIDETHYPLGKMVEVNEGSLRCDGIERLDENGIHFTDEVIAKMRDVFAMDYPKTLALEDCERFSMQIADTMNKHNKGKI